MTTSTFKQVSEHVYKLELPFMGLTTAVWLVHGPDGWTLVDAGAANHEEILPQQVLSHTKGERPTLVILTHGHPDHGGVADLLRERWHVRMAAGRDEIPYLIGPGFYHDLPGSWLFKVVTLSTPPPALLGRNVQLPLDEGMLVNGLRVYHVPGHTPGMIALLHEADQFLICADTWMNLGGRLSDPFAPFTYDMALNRRSQEKLAGLPFKHLGVSHGPVVRDTGHVHAQEYVARHTKRG